MTMNLTEKCRGWFQWQASEFGKSIVLWNVLQTKFWKRKLGAEKKKKVPNIVLLENTNEKMKVNGAYWSFTYLRECVQALFLMSLVMRAFHFVERFHMTSWRPIILVFRNIETTPMLLVEINPVKAFFCSNYFA